MRFWKEIDLPGEKRNDRGVLKALQINAKRPFRRAGTTIKGLPGVSCMRRSIKQVLAIVRNPDTQQTRGTRNRLRKTNHVSQPYSDSPRPRIKPAVKPFSKESPAKVAERKSDDRDIRSQSNGGVSKIIEANRAGQTHISIVPSSELLCELQTAILHHGEILTKEQESDRTLEELERRFQGEIREFESSIAEIERCDHSDPSREQLQSLNSQVHQIRLLAASVLKNKQEQFQEELGGAYLSQRSQLNRLFHQLGQLFSNHNLMAPCPILWEVNRSQDIADSVSNGTVNNPKKESTARENAEVPKLTPHSYDGKSIKPSKQNAEPQEESEDHSNQERPDDQVRSDSPSGYEVGGRKRTLLHEYHSKKMRLRWRNKAFEERDEKYNREVETRRQALITGEDIVSPTELDLQHFVRNQKATQTLIRAENDYKAAKDAALAGGVELDRLGSEVESGFRSDSDDGYRLSSEESLISEAKDCFPWQYWLDGLPDSPSSAGLMGEMDPLPSSEVDLDEWDARSVELCDSASMRAEDPWRKRIDRWRKVCELFSTG